jgi:hypothetical protein
MPIELDSLCNKEYSAKPGRSRCKWPAGTQNHSRGGVPVESICVGRAMKDNTLLKAGFAQHFHEFWVLEAACKSGNPGMVAEGFTFIRRNSSRHSA